MTEKIYIGTKIVAAEPMTETDFLFRKDRTAGIVMDHPDRDGYRVRYEDGYVSWSPKEVFERCYREVTRTEQRLVMKDPLLTSKDWKQPEGESWFQKKFGVPREEPAPTASSEIEILKNSLEAIRKAFMAHLCEPSRESMGGPTKAITAWVYVIKSAGTGDHYMEIRHQKPISGDIIKVQDPRDTFVAGPIKIEYEVKV